jgi:O-glycosyl hydrolase
MLRCYRKPFIVVQAMLLATIVFFSTQSAHPPIAQAASTTVTVNPAQQFQTIQGWGTSLAWWANIIGGWSDSQRTALANALYDTSDGIGLNVVRYNFGADGPGNTCESQITAGRNVPSFEPTQGNYVWTNDANQLWFAQAAQARGANVFEGFVNSAPAWMLLNSCTAGGTSGQDNLSSAHYNDFASYIATIDQHFHDSFGITLQTVEPFNEPLGTWWTSSGTQEGMYVSRSTQNTVIPLVEAALAQNGASAYSSVAAPDDNTVTWSVGDYTSYSSSTQADMTQWNTHSYGGSDSDRAYAYAQIGQGAKKTLWMSEWGIKSQGSNIAAALALSHQILDDEQTLHPTSWVAWQAVNEANDTADDVWGLAYRDSNNNISYPSRYYAMGNYSKFVRPGYIMLGNSDSNTFTAYNPSTNSLVIVATNSSSSSSSVTYNLSNFSGVGSTATPYQTTASENLQQLTGIGISSSAFSATLPAQSITTFVIPNVTYSGSTVSNYYKLVNRNSGKVLEVASQSTADGGTVDQWTDNGGTNQQWALTPTAGSYYRLFNRNSGKDLEVKGQSTANGGTVDQWTDNGGTNQQWNLVAVSGGYYKLVNVNSGKVLEVAAYSTANGGTVDQWTDNGGTNQQWSIVAI